MCSAHTTTGRQGGDTHLPQSGCSPTKTPNEELGCPEWNHSQGAFNKCSATDCDWTGVSVAAEAPGLPQLLDGACSRVPAALPGFGGPL